MNLKTKIMDIEKQIIKKMEDTEKSSFHSKVEICSKVNKRIYVFMDKYRMRECNFFREVFDKFSKRELLK